MDKLAFKVREKRALASETMSCNISIQMNALEKFKSWVA